jgi:hypothetical protein
MDISYGSIAMRRGHWSDRLAAIDQDLDAMTVRLRNAQRGGEPTQNTRQAIEAATSRPFRLSIDCTHLPPAGFRPGAPLALVLTVPQSPAADALASVVLHSRHVDQAERWKRTETSREGNKFSTAIPGEYTQSPYALEYYFEFRAQNGSAWLHPTFDPTLENQPYYLIERESV